MIPGVLIIAEAGVNHNGCLKRAFELIDAAAEAGVDYVKFQSFQAKSLVTKEGEKASYQKKAGDANESQYDMIRKLELSPSDHERLIGHCKARDVKFLSTAFDISSFDLLCSVGIDRVKIPSGEITNVPYLRRVGGVGLPVILSTGMSTLAEIEFAIETLELVGMRRRDLTVLHCNTEYPTPMHDVNLRAMVTIRDAFNVAVGYSDHTLGIEIPIAAVAMGACVIEKHFTLDRSLPGPDHAASLEPGELIAMVRSIRNVELALGDGLKRPSKSEGPNKNVARKSIVASRPILKGELFTSENLTVKRPGNGISPTLWDQCIGRVASRDYFEDEVIQW
jgi:N,N'-diacetyllegionaminate synthase